MSIVGLFKKKAVYYEPEQSGKASCRGRDQSWTMKQKRDCDRPTLSNIVVNSHMWLN